MPLRLWDVRGHVVFWFLDVHRVLKLFDGMWRLS